MKKDYDFFRGHRRAIDPIPEGKTRITIRLDNDVLGDPGNKWMRRVEETTKR